MIGAFTAAVCVSRCEIAGAGDEATALSTLRQTVHHFDFEDADAGPNSLPLHFYRYLAPKQGFPPFGSMRLTSEVAARGEKSLAFELGGGSMSARIGTSVIPVLPLADYLITCQVRTDALSHARARLVAWLHDTAGNVIVESRVESRLAHTSGSWEPIMVEVLGDFPTAADLVIELQLVQPAQFDPAAIQPHQPNLEDTSGRAWFDEVIVSHLPRVSLRMMQPGNIARADQSPEFQIIVNELALEPLDARLRAFDLDGLCVHDSTFPAPRGRRTGAVRLPISRCGWYRAVLEIRGQDALVRRRWLDFVVLPSLEIARVSPDRQFGVNLVDDSSARFEDVPFLMENLGAGTAVVPIWTERTGSDGDRLRQAARHAMIERMLQRNVDFMFTLDALPDELARTLGMPSGAVLAALAADPQIWRPYLDETLANFGLEVNRWQIGVSDDGTDQWRAEHSEKLAQAAKVLSSFISEPQVFTPWSIEQNEIADHQRAISIAIPHHVAPDAVDAYATAWLEQADEIVATLDTLPVDSYSPRRRMIDLVHRTLHAWRSGLPCLVIQQPWQHDHGRDQTVSLDPAFAVWRTLIAELGDRHFVGELLMPEGLHCWILRGEHTADAALIAWADAGATNNGSNLFQAQLAHDVINVVDVFGNRQRVDLIDGLHSVMLTETPLFIENVSLELAQFRGSLRIEPDFVLAASKVQEHEIVLSNPWNSPVTGTIAMVDDDQWRLVPSSQDFSIPPHGEVRLPLSIIPERGILAGRKRVRAAVRLNAQQSYTLQLHADVEVGLKNIEAAATWSIASNPRTGVNDVIVVQTVTNKGRTAVTLDVDLLAEGVSQNRRTIAGLAPGQTEIRSFRIPNGAALLAGKPVRVGVTERDGLARLNSVLHISPRPAQSIQASAGDR